MLTVISYHLLQILVLGGDPVPLPSLILLMIRYAILFHSTSKIKNVISCHTSMHIHACTYACIHTRNVYIYSYIKDSGHAISCYNEIKDVMIARCIPKCKLSIICNLILITLRHFSKI